MTDRKSSVIAGLVRAIAGRPWTTLGAILAGVVVALWMALGLGVQSSRHALVSADHPYQARLLSLVQDFGLPDDLIFWVEGGTPAQRRAAVRTLAHCVQQQADPLGSGQLTGPPSLAAWAPVFAAQNSDALHKILQGMGTQSEVKAALSSGLLGLLDRSYAQMSDPGSADRIDLEQMERSGQLLVALESLMNGASLSELSAGLIEDSRKGAGPGTKDSTVVPLDDAGFLRSDDGTALLLVVSQVLENDEGTAMDAVVEAARKAQASAQSQVDPQVKIRLSGYPVVQVDEQEAIAQGLLSSSAATGLGIILVLSLAFWSLRKSLIALLPLGVGAALSLGALWLLFGQVNAITSSFLAVLLGLGIDISVHLLARVDEGADEGERGGRLDRMSEAFAAAGPAVLVGTVTTALAFLLLFGAEFQAYGELGLITAVGLMLMMAAAFLALPALLVIWPGQGGASAVRRSGEKGLASWAQWVVKRPSWVLTVGMGAALLGGYKGADLRFNPRYFDFMPGALQSVELLERLEKESVASPLAVSVRASSLHEAQSKRDRLVASPLVAAVQSPSDLLSDEKTDFSTLSELAKWWPSPNKDAAAFDATRLANGVKVRAQRFVDLIDEQLFSLSMQRSTQKAKLKPILESWKRSWERIGALAKDAEKSGPPLVAAQRQIQQIRDSIARLVMSKSVVQGAWQPQDIPATLGRRFLAKTPEAGLRLIVTPAGDFWAAGRAQAFLDLIEGVDPQSAGHSMSVIVHSSMIRRDFFRASAWALLAIAVVLALTFRRLRSVIMIVVPLAVGWCWMLGLYAAMGIRLNAANIVVLPLVLGIGVDAGVHLMHRIREESASSQGIAKAVAATGSAITICSLTTMVGFAGLMVAEYGGMKSLGLSMVIGIFTTWLSTLLVMPAMLVLFSGRNEADSKER